MAKPSYYPLSLVKCPDEGTTSPSPEQPFKEDSDLVDKAAPADPPASHSSMILAPLRPQLFRKSPSTGRPPPSRRMKTPLRMALLPLAAIAYLVFCYTVRGRVVPVSTYGLYAVTPEHLATIKGGITSISIIVISIALYPIYDMVADLKSEEFFRTLASHSNGVPLETINFISTPSFGYLGMMMAMWRHRCSIYYILGIVASLLVWIVATLAPGALTVESVLSDGELVAFAVGAAPVQSVINGTEGIFLGFSLSSESETAASIAWVEMELDAQYSFSTEDASNSDYAALIAPVPLDLSTTTSARWLSDVIGINPTCSWASTNLTAPVQTTTNTSAFDQYLATAYLADFNLDVQIKADDISLSVNQISSFASVKQSTDVTNHTTQAPASDGSTVFLLGQCQSGTSCIPGFKLDLTSLNTTFTITWTNATWSMAILVCLPGVSVETREVRSNGHGLISVQPLPGGRQLTRQGNLNVVQTTVLFSAVTSSLTQYGGQLPTNLVPYSALGSQVQADVLFGHAQFQSLGQLGLSIPAGSISPAPIGDITQQYTQLLRSAAKAYLAGNLGTTYVPGRISESELVFAASVPNLAVSTAVFVLLAALLVLVNFRSGKDSQFTLVNVAAALHGSELPAQFAQGPGGDEYGRLDTEGDGDPDADGGLGKGKTRRAGNDLNDSRDIVDIYSDRHIFMQRRADGSPVLHMS